MHFLKRNLAFKKEFATIRFYVFLQNSKDAL